MNKKLTDKELIEGMTKNRPDAIYHFFFEQCAPMFHRINKLVYNRQAKFNELVNDFYIDLQNDDWHKLKQFDYRIQLSSWASIIAIRFFYKKQAEKMDTESIEDIFDHQCPECIEEQIFQKLEIENLINRLKNQRDRFVLQKLYLDDMLPQEVADEMETSVENVYNLRSRAINKLRESFVFRKKHRIFVP